MFNIYIYINYLLFLKVFVPELRGLLNVRPHPASLPGHHQGSYSRSVSISMLENGLESGVTGFQRLSQFCKHLLCPGRQGGKTISHEQPDKPQTDLMF